MLTPPCAALDTLMNVGVHTIPADTYHADQIDDERPSLSASIAAVLCTQSPAHARAKHPRLNPDFKRAEEQKFDVGTAAHALFLEGRDAVHVVAALDWRTKAAQEEKTYAREMGKLPLLTVQWAEVQAMCQSIRGNVEQIAVFPPLFTEGQAEQVIVWEDDGVLCRARLDWLRDDNHAIDDLKSTSRSANPELWNRTMLGMGADIQARMYQRGVEAVTGERPAFRFAVVETNPPYELCAFALSPEAEALADAKIDYALATWRRCIENDEWPGYPRQVCYLIPPAWAETQWLEREVREGQAA